LLIFWGEIVTLQIVLHCKNQLFIDRVIEKACAIINAKAKIKFKSVW